MQEIIFDRMTEDEAQTNRLAQEFSVHLKHGDCVLLSGDLGMGKSVFSRAVIRALLQDEEVDVPSPTYTLVQFYDAPEFEIAHFDLYRLNDPSEIYEIGWEDAISGGVSLVEWPERLGTLLPKVYWDVTLCAVKNEPNHRHIKIKRIGHV